MIPNEIVSILKEAKSIAILPHVSADGDALGSCIALGLALKKLDKEAVIYIEENIPYNLQFLPGQDFVTVYSPTFLESSCSHATEFCRKTPDAYDAVIALDTGDMGRLGARTAIFSKSSVTVNIDHHKTNTEFAKYNYIDTHSSSVGEIVYQLIKIIGLDIDADIARCLYVAIATDTGGFRYSNTTATTHQIAADLINNGVNVAEISQKVFDSAPFSKVKLMGEAINSIELLEKGAVSLIIVNDEMLQRANAREEDSEGLVNIGRGIEGVEVSILLRERNDGLIKANLRSNSYVDVSAIAECFNGGGHKRASGFTIEGPLEDIRERLLAKIREVLVNEN